MPTIKNRIEAAIKQLEAAGIEDARFNISCMASALLNASIGRLPLFWPKEASTEFCNGLKTMLNRRLKREPLQYIVKIWSFLDLELETAPEALIPRPETEEVFEAAKKFMLKEGFAGSFVFADIGTGTGALGMAMAKSFEMAKGFLVDISKPALQLAAKNLSRYPSLKARLSLLNADMLTAFSAQSLDLIISNPPYIAQDDIKNLMSEVKDYEPLMALNGGSDGLEAVKRLISQSVSVLRVGGLLVFEHGSNQRAAIKNLIPKELRICVMGNDLSGCERYFILRKEGIK